MIFCNKKVFPTLFVGYIRKTLTYSEVLESTGMDKETIQKLFTQRRERDLVFTPLVPASTQAAELFNCWDYTQFCNGLVESNGGALGTWCIEQDRWNNYVFAQAVSKMFNRPM